MEDINNQTSNIELKTAQNIEQKRESGEFQRWYVTIRLEKNLLDSVVAYANMIGMEPDRLFEKVLYSGIKTLRGSLNNLPHTSIPKIIERYGVQITNAPILPQSDSTGGD